MVASAALPDPEQEMNSLRNAIVEIDDKALDLPDATSTGEVSASPPVANSQPRRVRKIRSVLAQTPTGQQALAIIDRYNVSIGFVAGSKGYFSPGENKITLGRDYDIPTAALVLVHEANHTKAHNDGSGVNTYDEALQLSREQYILGMITEEATADLLRLQTFEELNRLPRDQQIYDYSTLGVSNWDAYRRGRQQGIDALLALNPRASPDELASAGAQGGLQAMIAEFYTGNVITSTTGESYLTFYGKYWDAVHKKPTGSIA